MSDVVRDKIAKIAHHEIEEKLIQPPYRHIRCGRPKSVVFHFNVTTFPGRLVVSGDIGFMAWERCEDMFTWAPGAIKSIDYFEEKVPRELGTKEYEPDLAREVLTELIDEDKDLMSYEEHCERTDKIKDCMRHVDEGIEVLSQEVYQSDLFDGCDFPDFTTFSSRFLWMREALLWFFEKKGMMP